jgi:hypothetical protein
MLVLHVAGTVGMGIYAWLQVRAWHKERKEA